MKKTIIALVVLLSAGLGVYFFTKNNKPDVPFVNKTEMSTSDKSAQVSLPGTQQGPLPWLVETTHLKERLNAMGLPALSAEGTALHIHQHLDIFIDGKSVGIPAGIGINENDRFISDIHTHDDTGIIHVESPTIQTFTLGQFFDIWGVSFTASNIGRYSNQTAKTLKVFVNGELYLGDPRELALKAHQEIVVSYGTDSELPNPIPSAYTFSAGE